MKISDCIKMAFSDLKHRKFRTCITVFSLAIGTMLIISMFDLSEGLKDMAINKFLVLGEMRIVQVFPTFTPKNSNQLKQKKIDAAAINKMSKLSNIDGINVRLDTKITGTEIGNKKAGKVAVIGEDQTKTIFFKSAIDAVKADPKYKDKKTQPIIAGNILKKDDENCVLIGKKYLDKLRIKDYNSIIGQNIKLNIQMPSAQPFTINAQVKGVVNDLYEEGNSIIVPIKMAGEIQEIYTGEQNYLNNHGPSSVNIEAKTNNDVKDITNKISQIGYDCNASQYMIDEFETMFSILKVLMEAGGIIVLLVSSIGVVNTMGMAVYEKTKYIGIMKAVGASKRNIKTIFVVQSGTLGFLGGILGIVLGLTAATIINYVIQNMMKKGGSDGIQTIAGTPAMLIAAALILSVIVSIIAGLVPSAKAAKLDPIKTLSYE